MITPTRIVFFQPRTLAERNYLNASGAEQTWAPWFAPMLAPIAIQYGLSVSIIDARIDANWRAEVLRLQEGDILAASVMTGAAIRDAIDASELARGRGALVLWGGPHPTLFPNETIKEAPVDGIVVGFGQPGLSALLNELMNPSSSVIEISPNTTYRLKSSLRQELSYRKVPSRPVVVEADEAAPHLDLIQDWDPYLNPDVAIAERTTNFVTSEGCTRRCTFCSEPRTSNGAWYRRSIETSIVSLTELFARSGANGLKLHDPNFFADQARALAFAELLSRAVSVPWAASLHPADLIEMSDDSLAKAAEHGLVRVLVGLETPIPELIQLAGKKYDPNQIPSMARRLASFGIRGMFTFIVGWPDADESHYEKTIAAALSIRDISPEHQCKIHFLEPWPGTPIFRMLERRGLEFPNRLEDWANIDYYNAQYQSIHDARYETAIREANASLSPYVDA